MSTSSNTPNSAPTGPQVCNHIRLTIEKISLTIESVTTKMKGEKLTPQIEQKLRELISALKQTPFKTDQEIQSSFVSLLWEISDNMKTLSYYAEEWRKCNIITRASKGSKIRAKMAEIIKSVVNYTRLIDTVT